jgi:hypothetical protein
MCPIRLESQAIETQGFRGRFSEIELMDVEAVACSLRIVDHVGESGAASSNLFRARLPSPSLTIDQQRLLSPLSILLVLASISGIQHSAVSNVQQTTEAWEALEMVA